MVTDKTNSPGLTQTNKLNEFLTKAVYHWPLYVIMVTLALVGAYMYIRYTQPVYLSSAKIYIKDEKKGSRELDALKELSMFSSSKVVENEMEIIKSPLLIQDVIRNNQFNIRYFVKGRVINKEAYESNPIRLKVLSDSGNVGNHFFEVEVKGNALRIQYKTKENPELSVNTTFDQPFVINKDTFAFQRTKYFGPAQQSNYQIKVDSILPLAYRKASEVKTSLINKQASVFELSYEDEVAKRAADFLNQLLYTYNLYTLKDKNQITVNTIEFIESRLASLGTELSGLEQNVESFKKARGITEIGASAKMFMEQIKEADQKLNEASLQLEIYNQVESYVNNPNSANPYTPVAGVADPALAGIIGRYEEQLKEKKRLSLSLQPGNPILQNIEQQIVDSRSSIKNYIAGYKRNASTAKAGLQRKVNQVEGMISKVPSYEREYIGIERQKNVKEALYLYLLQKKEESGVSYASSIVDNKIISPAYISQIPISPRRTTVLAAFALAGLALTTLYLFIKYALNQKIHSKKDIERFLSFPVIAQIFHEDVKSKDKVLKPRSLLAEQMLNLRNNLKFLTNKVNGSPVIMFTSSVSGEGKTFLAANLARFLTMNERKVVLLELDLRKPKLAKALGVQSSTGISNYLLGIGNPEEIIKKVPETDRLYIIPSGPIPPNPVELLESDRMVKLINYLKEKFDYVIIDTAPIGLVTDAKSLSSFVDTTLFIVRFNYTYTKRLADVADSLDQNHFKSMGVIFNDVDPNSSYGYASYGSYNNGYGYGYFVSEQTGFSRVVRQFAQRLL